MQGDTPPCLSGYLSLSCEWLCSRFELPEWLIFSRYQPSLVRVPSLHSSRLL